MTRKHRILVVDDEEFVRESLIAIVEAEGWDVSEADGARGALRCLESERIDAIVSDLSMPDGDGLELLRASRERGIEAPLILLTGVGKVSDAVTAIKNGAYDFIQKPIEPQQLVLLIRRALEHHDLISEVAHLRSTVRDLRGPARMVGASPWFQSLQRTLDQVAPTEAIVLVTGESGTGKELVALEVHRRSRRQGAALVQVNCAAISENLFESEFFGHRRGSFTGADSHRTGRFAEAEGGTLVLDEVGTLKPEMQAKLLRVLETGEYQVVGESSTRLADVRVVAVTNEELEARVQEGAFRADLYYRLNIFPIRVPPLRERREDVPALATYFWRRFATVHGGTSDEAPGLSQECLEVLQTYDWPGNTRELRNVMERAMILAGGVSPEVELVRGLVESAASAVGATTGSDDLALRPRLDALEAELIQKAVERTNGVKREAAKLLGIDPKNFGYYLRKHDLSDKG